MQRCSCNLLGISYPRKIRFFHKRLCNTVPLFQQLWLHLATQNHSTTLPAISTCRADTFVPWKVICGCCLCCPPQLLWNLFCMFVETAMLWSNFPLNLCVLLQAEIVSTWVGNVQTNTPKLRMAPTSHLFLVSAWGFKPTKMGREVSCLFCVSEVMVTSYYGRQSIAKWTAQPYLMITDWLLIALSHTVPVLNLIINVELIHLYFYFYYYYYYYWNTFEISRNSWSISDYVLHAIFKASPVSQLNTRTTSLSAVKIFSRNREACT